MSVPDPTDADPVTRRWGQITVTSRVVITPVGVYDLAGTRWSADEHWQTSRRRPTWALVAGLLTWWTVFGIAFFYVVREEHWGQVSVTMQAPNGGWWTDTMHVNSPQHRASLMSDVMALDNWSITALNAQQPTGAL